MSSSNAVRIAYRVAGSGDPFKVLRYTSEAFTATPATTESGEVRVDRMIADLYLTSLESSGSIDFELSAQNFDDLMEAVMCSTFDGTTGEMKVGTNDNTFEILKSYTDTTPAKHVLINDVKVSTMTLNINAGELVTGTFEFVGGNVDVEFDPSGETFTAPANTSLLNAANDIGAINVNGAELTGTCIESLTVTIDNNYQAQNCIGSLAAKTHVKNTASVSGSETLSFSAEAYDLWKGQISNADITLDFTVTDGTNTYKFDLPRVRISGDLPGGTRDEILTLDAEYTAILDETLETSFMITRTPAA